MATEKKNGSRAGNPGSLNDIKLSSYDSTGKKNCIKDSLKKLNTAAKNKQEEISTVIGIKYEDLRQKINDVNENNKIRIGLAKIKAADTVHNSSRKVKDAASLCNNTVHANPWPVIGGVALAGFAAGLVVMTQIKRAKSNAAGITDAEIVPMPIDRAAAKGTRSSSTRQSATARGPQL